MRSFSLNVHRIDPLTGNYGEIVNSFTELAFTNAKDSAVRYAKGERRIHPNHHYVVTTGLAAIYDTRDEQ